MGTAKTRIDALKVAHPNSTELRIQLSDAEAVELVADVPDASAALKDAATALSDNLKVAAPADAQDTRSMQSWLSDRMRLHAALWELLEGRIVNDVTVLEAR